MIQPSDAAVGGALVPRAELVSATAEPGLVPVASSRSTFARYQRREGLLVNVAAGAVFGVAIGSAAVSTVLWGPLWGLGLLGLGFSSVGWMANAWGLFGNEGLERRMRAELRLGGTGWTFVGLCRGDQNRLSAKLLPPRVETDENVGFLRLGSDRMEIRMEGVRLEVLRDRVRDVRLEEVVEAPFLEWVRIEVYDEDGRLDAFLVMARRGDTLRAQRRENRALFDRIRDWHVQDKLRPLVDAGELPAWLVATDASGPGPADRPDQLRPGSGAPPSGSEASRPSTTTSRRTPR